MVSSSRSTYMVHICPAFFLFGCSWGMILASMQECWWWEQGVWAVNCWRTWLFQVSRTWMLLIWTVSRSQISIVSFSSGVVLISWRKRRVPILLFNSFALVCHQSVRLRPLFILDHLMSANIPETLNWSVHSPFEWVELSGFRFFILIPDAQLKLKSSLLHHLNLLDLMISRMGI